MQKTVGQLAQHVGGQVDGDGALVITGAATLNEAAPGDITFLANPKYDKLLEDTRASAVVVGMETPANGHTVIRCRDPYYAFMQIVVAVHGHREHRAIGVSARASVAGSARLGENVDIHDFTCISEAVEIGAGTRIYPNCTIGPGSVIGKDCIIYPNVTVYDGCRIGDRVTIHSGTVIGQDGFGYATHGGAHHKIPQIGAVIIEDDVEIGANCAIDRGTLGDTVIGRGCKFSNLVAIGHNTRLGPHCLLVAQVGIAGSVEVGEYCTFGGQTGVVGHIKIGNRVTIAAKSGVTNSVPDGETMAGSPAMPINQAKRSLTIMKDLPALRRKLRELEKAFRTMVRGQNDGDRQDTDPPPPE